MSNETKHDETGYVDFERTLRKLRPAAMGDLQHQLEAAAGRRDLPPRTSSLADGLLAAWTFAGALAACFVAVFTLCQLAGGPRRAPAVPQDVALHQQAMQEFQQLIASR